MLLVFDTNVLIDMNVGQEGTIAKVREFVSGLPSIDCAITWVNFFEYYYGAHETETSANESLEFLNTFTFLPMDKEATKLFSVLKKRKLSVKDFDLLIASVCLANGALLLTRDGDFKRVPNLNCKII